MLELVCLVIGIAFAACMILWPGVTVTVVCLIIATFVVGLVAYSTYEQLIGRK